VKRLLRSNGKKQRSRSVRSGVERKIVFQVPTTFVEAKKITTMKMMWRKMPMKRFSQPLFPHRQLVIVLLWNRAGRPVVKTVLARLLTPSIPAALDKLLSQHSHLS
jgi:hypothetical protein